MIWRLNQSGRNLKDLIDWLNYLDTQKVAVKSPQQSIDTRIPTGKLVFHLFGASAEFERNLIVDRTNAGLQAAKAIGIKGGRKHKLDTPQFQFIVLFVKQYFENYTY